MTRKHRLWIAPLLVIMIMMATVSYSHGRPVFAPGGFQLILILTGAVALLFRYHFPVAVTAVTVVTGSLLPLTARHLVLIDVAAVVALYTLATLRDRRTAWTAGVLAAVALTAASLPWQPGGLLDLANLVPINYVAIAVAAGDATRNRRALQTEIADRAVQEERLRIARDLHDVVAHHIALVNAQAGVAHHLMPTHPEKAREALAGLRDTSRAALDELRATVGLLRQEGDPDFERRPAPTLAGLDDLLDGFRTAGIDITVTGPPPALDAATDLAAYRIIQEALTNAGKHGTERRASVTLTRADRTLEITVTNPARPGHRGEGTGHGLTGMRERATAAGGTVTAGLQPDGTWTVHATLPMGR
ncbi:sensor histidine kinase [Paractinoplanes toevensis]|uniref:histidine kinase n=1 Tax=Paractinoplanes toevensis TaxID=571911 RepID=A0A920BPL6_9ACTN|nr:histidine kinase [Actinoplanes toevensis]GIM96539.1 two-component sensor histidine kinase [Actinoplanes toevensis]